MKFPITDELRRKAIYAVQGMLESGDDDAIAEGVRLLIAMERANGQGKESGTDDEDSRYFRVA